MSSATIGTARRAEARGWRRDGTVSSLVLSDIGSPSSSGHNSGLDAGQRLNPAFELDEVESTGGIRLSPLLPPTTQPRRTSSPFLRTNPPGEAEEKADTDLDVMGAKGVRQAAAVGNQIAREALKKVREHFTPTLQRKINVTEATKTKNLAQIHQHLVEAINADRIDRQDSARLYNREAALLLAVKSRDPHVVEPLLDKVAHFQYQDRNGDTALHVACQNGDTEILELLLSKGNKVDLGKTNKRGRTALVLAVMNENEDTVECLLAQKRLTSPDLERSLEAAAIQGNVGIFEQLLDYTKSQLNAEVYNRAMVTAAEYGNQECLEMILKEDKVDVNFVAGAGQTALHKCVLKVQNIIPDDVTGHINCVELLLQHGADPDATDMMKGTPLRYAAGTGSYEITKLLLDYGANPDVVDSLDNLPLHAAASSGETDCLELLLSRTRTDTMARNLYGKTYLHVACQEAGPECIEKILDSDPRVVADIADNNGYTAIHYAAAKGDDSIINALIDKDCYKKPGMKTKDKNTPLHLAAGAKENPSLMALLISQGESPNSENERGETPLHIAVTAGNEKNAWKLYSSGAKLTILDKAGNTPLRLMLQKMPQLVRKLLDGLITTNGMAPDAKDLHVLFGFHDFASARSDEASIVATQDPAMTAATSAADCSTKPDLVANHCVPTGSLGDFHGSSSFGPFNRRARMTSDTSTFMDFVHTGQQQLLAHPICRVFAQLKWHRYRKLWMAYLMLNLIFVLSLSVYECTFYGYIGYELIGNPGILYCPHNHTTRHGMGKVLVPVDRHNASLGSTPKFVTLDEPWQDGLCALYKVCFFLMHISMALLAMLEFFQIALYRMDYFNQLENLSQWLTFILTMLTDPLPSANVTWHNVQHHIAAICVLLAWTQLMMFVGRSPSFGMYIAMFRQMAWVFMQFVFIYMWIIIGSALALFILFVGSIDPDTNRPVEYNPYDNPGKSFMKAVIMLTGEFDFVSSFENELPYPGTTHVVYLGFVLVVTLILGNLLVSLAVNELQKIQRQADIKRLVNMLELIAYVEYVIPYSKIAYSPTEDSDPYFKPNDRENRNKLYVSLKRGFLPKGLAWRAMSPSVHNMTGSTQSIGSTAPRITTVDDKLGWIKMDKDIRSAALKIVQTREQQEQMERKRSEFFYKRPASYHAPTVAIQLDRKTSPSPEDHHVLHRRRRLTSSLSWTHDELDDHRVSIPPRISPPKVFLEVPSRHSPSLETQPIKKPLQGTMSLATDSYTAGDRTPRRTRTFRGNWSPSTRSKRVSYSPVPADENGERSSSQNNCCGLAAANGDSIAACQHTMDLMQRRIDNIDSKLDYAMERLDQLVAQTFRRRRHGSADSLSSAGC